MDDSQQKGQQPGKILTNEYGYVSPELLAYLQDRNFATAYHLSASDQRQLQAINRQDQQITEYWQNQEAQQQQQQQATATPTSQQSTTLQTSQAKVQAPASNYFMRQFQQSQLQPVSTPEQFFKQQSDKRQIIAGPSMNPFVSRPSAQEKNTLIFEQQPISSGPSMIELPSTNNIIPTGTRLNMGENYLNIPLYSPGTIYQYQTGSVNYEERDIPFYKTYTVNPDWSSSISSDEDIKSFNTYIASKEYAETALAPPRSEISKVFGEFTGRVQKLGSEELFSQSDIKSIQTYSSQFGSVGEIVGGSLSGFLPRTKGDLINTGLILGVGAAFGFGVKGLSSFASYVGTDVFGASAITGNILGGSVKLGALGYGAYTTATYGINKASQFEVASSTFEKSGVVGGSIREVGVGIIGYGFGSQPS